MDCRVNMIMVPASNLDSLRDFYEQGLGWNPWGPEMPASIMYKVGSALMVFLDRNYLASESGIDVSATPRAIYAVFVNDKRSVDEQMARVEKAGGTITSAVRDRDGGLYSGYFTDPEGNAWEIVWSPVMPVDEDDAITLNVPQES